MRLQRFQGSVGFFLLLCSFSSVQTADESDAQEQAGEPVAVEVFKGPELIDMKLPPYPHSETSHGDEGWVLLNFMIDPKGKPYEIAVVDSTGNEAFEKAARRSVAKWTFDPATVDGRPVDAGLNFKLTFVMHEPAKGADPRFVGAYRRLLKSIEAGDRRRADRELARLRVRNLYEDVYKNLGGYHYHRKWGTEVQQLYALRRAIAGEQAPRYLEKKMFRAALEALLVLELKVQDFGSALKSWEKLQRVSSREKIEKWQNTIDQVLMLRKDDREVRLSGHIERGTSWFGYLFKNRFEIVVSSGHVSEIKLRCDKKYVFFRYEPRIQYDIDDRHGNCAIELVGEQGTQFELIQS